MSVYKSIDAMSAKYDTQEGKLVTIGGGLTGDIDIETKKIYYVNRKLT